MTKRRFVFASLAIVFSAASLVWIGGSEGLAKADRAGRWDVVKKTDHNIKISPEWETPVNVEAPVNTPGWEDSASVSGDGNTMTFAYYRIDPIALIFKRTTRIAGPMRPGWPAEEPAKSYGAGIYVTKRVNGAWSEPQSVGDRINIPGTAVGDQWLSADGNTIYFNSSEGNRKKGIYYSERKNASSPWSTPVYLDSNINSGHDDENPYLSSDGKELYFESSRSGGFGKKDLYVSALVNGQWQPPRNMGPKINSAQDDVQPFVSGDGKTFLFSRNESIYRSQRQADGSWGDPEEIVSGAVGEPTMTDSGDLYFVHVYKNGDREFDSDIMMAKRKK